jgi:DNA-binding response OmpR family regulator
MKDGIGQNGTLLTDKQQKAIPVILAARNITEGLSKANIARTTFYEWLKTPSFKAELIRQRKEIVDAAIHDLKVSAGDAVAVLRGLLSADEDGIKLRTALGILDYIGKFVELEELEHRITELERRQVKQ